MEAYAVGDLKRAELPADDPVEPDPFDQIPELPAAVGRWTVRLKAELVRAVRGGWVPIEEVCRLYGISAEEFVAWGAISPATASPGCGRRATRSIAIPKSGRAENEAPGLRGAAHPADIFLRSRGC